MTANPSNPAYDCVFHAQHENLYEQHQRFIPSFGVRTIPHFEAAEIPATDILPNKLSSNPPWSLKIPSILYTMHNKSKSTTHPMAFQSLFAEIRHTYSTYQPIYTDGSKDREKVSAAMYAPPYVDTARLPNNSSIFSAELYALLLALQSIQFHKASKFIVFTDSLSSLQSLSSFKITHPLVLQLLEFYTFLLQKGKTIIFCWIPSHMGIRGNEKVDSIAKTALNSDMSSFKVPYSDFKPFSRKYINYFWQLEWDTLDSNKLHQIQSSLKQNKHHSRLSRRDNVVLTRLRIGHSHLTHSYLLKKEPQPVCNVCDVPLTVEHFLLTCSAFTRSRLSFFNVSSLKMLFEIVAPEHILSYLHSINFYRKI
ncbi:RNase H family protein [Solemya velum gill symbiont]|uniref:RNase H family protein n=1 Tax=Solemya velum gill symbiont TaxID=2340 RepID=UPI001C4E2DB6|nr:RNase H family protein [Solemya velum gill symbiont]